MRCALNPEYLHLFDIVYSKQNSSDIPTLNRGEGVQNFVSLRENWSFGVLHWRKCDFVKRAKILDTPRDFGCWSCGDMFWYKISAFFSSNALYHQMPHIFWVKSRDNHGLYQKLRACRNSVEMHSEKPTWSSDCTAVEKWRHWNRKVSAPWDSNRNYSSHLLSLTIIDTIRSWWR